MKELIQAGEKTWYIDGPAKIGVFSIGGGDVCLIDSGTGDSDAESALQLAGEMGFRVRAVFNTHAHVDHVGGNRLVQERTGCPVYVPSEELLYAQDPSIGPSIIFGGHVPGALHDRFFVAKGCSPLPLTDAVLPEGLSLVPLPGHSSAMTGFRTSDGVVFLADSLVSAATLEKYHISFVYSVGDYLRSLDKVLSLDASLFVPSHAEAASDISSLAVLNISKVNEIAARILDFCREPAIFEDVLQYLFSSYGLRMSLQQYVLVGGSVRSYLSWLLDENRLEILFENSRMLWHTL